jgi:hypothetical protein
LADADPLWKTLHYKIIEDFRLRLKADKALVSSFRYFLTDSICFYLQLVQKLILVYDLDIVLPFPCYTPTLPRVLVPDKVPILMFVHRCFIFLGDLARYLQVHSDKRSKHWRLSKLYYQLALKLFPNYGNPYNQLAVIQTYENNHIAAVYMYFKSLVVEFPFPTALDNLIIILHRFKDRSVAPSLSDSFLHLLSLLLTKEPNATAFSEASPMFITMLESSLAYRAELDFGLLFEILMISVSALFVYKDKDPLLADLFALFLDANFQVILTKMNANIVSQLSSGNLYNEVDHFEERFLFCEPYLPILKFILIFLSTDSMGGLDTSMSNVKRLAATCCTQIVKFRIKHFSYRSEIKDCCFAEDLEWNGFLPLQCPYRYHKGNVLLADDAKGGRLDQIKEIAIQMTQMSVTAFNSATHLFYKSAKYLILVESGIQFHKGIAREGDN